MYLSERTYKKGREALSSIEHLLTHLSGHVYRRRLLNLNLYEKTLLENFDDHKSFLVDELIRIHLACISDYRISSNVFWKYAVTERSSEKSQLAEGVKKDLHAPEFEYPRYRCEYKYCNNIVADEDKLFILRRTMIKWFRKVTYLYKFRNSNKKMLDHYNTEPIEFNSNMEKINFVKYSIALIRESDEPMRKQLKRTIYIEYLNSYTFFPMRKLFERITNKIKRLLITL